MSRSVPPGSTAFEARTSYGWLGQMPMACPYSPIQRPIDRHRRRELAALLAHTSRHPARSHVCRVDKAPRNRREKPRSSRRPERDTAGQRPVRMQSCPPRPADLAAGSLAGRAPSGLRPDRAAGDGAGPVRLPRRLSRSRSVHSPETQLQADVRLLRDVLEQQLSTPISMTT